VRTKTEQEIEHRIWRSWVEDGLPELVTGLGFFALAMVLWERGHAVGVWALALQYLQVGVILVLAFGARRLVQAAKWRVTYPRTGYVAYGRGGWRKREVWVAVAVGLVTVAGFAFVMAAESLSASASLMGLSAAMAAAFLYWAGRRGWERGFLYAVTAALAGPLAVMLSAGSVTARTFALQGGVHFVLIGVAQMAGGAWALFSYLRKYPLPLTPRRKSHE